MIAFTSCNQKDDFDYPQNSLPKVTKLTSAADNSVGAQHNILLSAYLDYFESNRTSSDSVAYAMWSIADEYVDKTCPASEWEEMIALATNPILIQIARQECEKNSMFVTIRKFLEELVESKDVNVANIPMEVQDFVDGIRQANREFSVLREDSMEAAMLSTLEYSAMYWSSLSNMSRWHAISEDRFEPFDFTMDSSWKEKVAAFVIADVSGARLGFLAGPEGAVVVGSICSGVVALSWN